MKEPTIPVVMFVEARNELGGHGIILQILPGEFRVNYAHGDEASAYYAEDLSAAVAVGWEMAADVAEGLPPMGPTGRRSSRRGLMYRHNAMIAAMRRAAGGVR